MLGSCSAPASRDADLMTRIVARDQVAFTTLFDHLAPTVLGLLVRILGARSIAEEVLQEVFLQVWKQAHLYRPDLSPARGWILLIARSRGLDRLRHERSSSRREEVAAEQVERRRVVSPPQFARLAEDERRRGLFDALEHLPADQRVCIKLALFEGLTHSQIAQRLAAPLGTVKSRMRMGMMKIREAVEARDAAPARGADPEASPVQTSLKRETG